MANGVNKKDKDVYFLYAETQLHAGAGSDLGVIDLPIQRERSTKFPIIQGVKGALRSYATTRLLKEDVENIFGSELGVQTDNKTQPGNVSFSEAKILLFPVRNPERLFVWVTCPLALSRYLHAAGDGKINQDIVNELRSIRSDDKALSSMDGQSLFLEEIEVHQEKYTKKLGDVFKELSHSAPIELLQKRIESDVVVVSDELFSKIVETMTEVVPRIAIENGVAKKGSLWYEEYLPQDTVMYFVVRTTNYGSEEQLNKLRETINGKLISIGGKETVGKGMAWVKCCRQEG